jgi:hypothetical protein
MGENMDGGQLLELFLWARQYNNMGQPDIHLGGREGSAFVRISYALDYYLEIVADGENAYTFDMRQYGDTSGGTCYNNRSIKDTVIGFFEDR